MPNWAEGTLRIRGKEKNIVRFIKDNICGAGTIEGGDYKVSFKYDEVHSEVLVTTDGPCFYMKDTRRSFIDCENLEIYLSKDKEGISRICIDNYKIAWGYTEDDKNKIIQLSKKYRIDIATTLHERGMEFTQELKVVNGSIIEDEQIKYSDYVFDSPFPNMGG